MSRPATVVRLSIIGAGLAYSVLLYLSDVQLDSLAKHAVALLPAVGTVVLTAWDGLLWRVKGLSRLTKRPQLYGLWKVTLSPTAESHIPEGGNRGPIQAFMTIEQSYWSVYVRQYTAESTSRSRTHYWELPAGADCERLVFTYENDPQQRYQQRSGRHFGVCVLDVASRSASSLTGVYFTDRYTKGDMEIHLIDRSKGYGSFAEVLSYADRIEQAGPR